VRLVLGMQLRVVDRTHVEGVHKAVVHGRRDDNVRLVASIFTRIVAGEIPAHKLREDERFLAFLDIRPIRAGHTLVIPKAEIDELFDLPDDLLGDLLVFAKPVAAAIKAETGATRVGVAVVGLEVPHAHVHLVPIDGLYDLDFRNAREADQDELAQMAQRLRARITD
jgi:histidine triad (HIT) family protein